MSDERERKGSAAAATQKSAKAVPEPAREAADKLNDRSPKREGVAEPSGALDSLSQLREILFGEIQRDLERRLTRADAHLAARASELEQQGRRRMEVVETHMRRETEALTARLERELAERGDALRAITREHRESLTALEQRVTKVEESVVRVQHELRDQLLEQAKSFLDELQRIRHELTETLERELGAGAALGDERAVGEEGDRARV
jgi:hypothetical protein